MPIPTKDTLKQVAEDFHRMWNFPNVIGCIDGKHVRIRCPVPSGSMFYNYKHFFSIVLQAVADANYQFLCIDVGGYGKQSDGGTFHSSVLYKMLITKKIEIPDPNFLPNTNVKAPYVFLGDEVYPLLNFLLKPYSGQNLPLDQDCFNKRHSRARKTVECSFGILFAKWRILSKPIETSVETADHIIKCICVLHNTILREEGMDRHFTNVELKKSTKQRLAGRPVNDAKTIRDVFTSYFNDNPIIYS